MKYILIKNKKEVELALAKLEKLGYSWYSGAYATEYIPPIKEPYFLVLDGMVIQFLEAAGFEADVACGDVTEVYKVKDFDLQLTLKARLNKIINSLDVSGKNTKLQVKIELEKIINELGE